MYKYWEEHVKKKAVKISVVKCLKIIIGCKLLLLVLLFICTMF